MIIEPKLRQTKDTDLKSALNQFHMGGTEEENTKLTELLSKYSDVFAFQDEDLGYTDKVKLNPQQFTILLTDETPISQPYCRIPPPQYNEVKEHIAKPLKRGVQESTSSYASPVVLVRKTDCNL